MQSQHDAVGDVQGRRKHGGKCRQRREERARHKNAVFSLLKPNRLQRQNVMSQTDFNLCTYPQRPARAAKGKGGAGGGGGGIAG